MKIEKDILAKLKGNPSSGTWGIVQEFNWRRLHKEMSALCNQYDQLTEQMKQIEDNLEELEANPPR